jgi:protein tyrosine kinase modulator
VSIVKPVVNQDTNLRLATMQQKILSKSNLEPIIQKLGLYNEEMGAVTMDDLVLKLRKNIEVTPVQPLAGTNAPGLPGFTISVAFANPETAQQICSTITSMFLDENSAVQQVQSEKTTDFLRGQLATAEADLNAQGTAMAVFQKQHLGELPDDRAMNLNVLNGLVAQLDAATQALARAQQDKTFAESSLAEQLAAWKATVGGRNPVTQEQQIAAMEAQLTALKSKYTDDHPDVARLKRDIEAAKKLAMANASKPAPVEPEAAVQIEPAGIKTLREQIHQYDQTIKDRTTQQEDLHRRIRIYQARVESSPAVEQEARALTRGQKAAQESYDDLKKQLELAERATELAQKQQGEQFSILEPANYPLTPSFPDQFRFSFGGLGAGIALGVGLTLLLEMRDTSVRSDKDVETLTHLPVLAVVPTLGATARKSKSAPRRVVASM